MKKIRIELKGGKLVLSYVWYYTSAGLRFGGNIYIATFGICGVTIVQYIKNTNNWKRYIL